MRQKKSLRDHLLWIKNTLNPTSFSNGRYIRNVIEKSIRTQAMRLLMQNTL